MRVINMESIKFNTLEELYNKLLPALETRVSELKLNGISYIKKDDIWNYLKKNKWSINMNLTLSKCVDDILNTNEEEFKLYVKNKMRRILGGD